MQVLAEIQKVKEEGLVFPKSNPIDYNKLSYKQKKLYKTKRKVKQNTNFTVWEYNKKPR